MKQALVGHLLVIIVVCSAIALGHSAQADIATWPQGCSIPHLNSGELRFEYDTSDLSHVQGIEPARLNKLLASAPEHYLGTGARATPVQSVAGVDDSDRVIIITTLFPLAVNSGTDRLVSRDSGEGLGIIQPDLGRWLTSDSGKIALRTRSAVDDAASLARSQATCITQFVAKVGLIECGAERFSSNSTHIREIWAIGLSPLIDVPEDGPFALISSADYLDRAIASCLDYFSGPHP